MGALHNSWGLHTHKHTFQSFSTDMGLLHKAHIEKELCKATWVFVKPHRDGALQSHWRLYKASKKRGFFKATSDFVYTHIHTHILVFCYRYEGASQSPYRDGALWSPYRVGLISHIHTFLHFSYRYWISSQSTYAEGAFQSPHLEGFCKAQKGGALQSPRGFVHTCIHMYTHLCLFPEILGYLTKS